MEKMKKMCKETNFSCDREGCKYTIPKPKNNIPIDFNPYPKDFKKVRINKKIYHLCPDCYQKLNQLNLAFIQNNGGKK